MRRARALAVARSNGGLLFRTADKCNYGWASVSAARTKVHDNQDHPKG